MNNEAKILAVLEQMQNDMADLRTELKTEMGDLRTEFRTEMTDMKTEMTGMKTEMADMKTGMADMKIGMANMKTGMADLRESFQAIRASQLRVELEELPRIAAAIEGVIGSNEKNVEQDQRIFVLENKTEKHDIRISSLEYACKA